MAKFIKNLFHSSDKKHSKSNDNLDDNREDFNPPLDMRRKLSMSRSGRMKQAYKKRRSLTMDTYGDNYHLPDKPTAKEYHVHGKAFTQTITTNDKTKTTNDKNNERKKSVTPEEEIDNAFKIIEKKHESLYLSGGRTTKIMNEDEQQKP